MKKLLYTKSNQFVSKERGSTSEGDQEARTNAPTGRVDRNWSKSGGKAPYPGFLLVGELAQVPHYPETRTSPGGYLHRA